MSTNLRVIKLPNTSYHINCDQCNDLLDKEVHSFGGNKLLTVYRLDGSYDNHVMLHSEFKKHTTKKGFFKDNAIERCTFTKAAMGVLGSFTR